MGTATRAYLGLVAGNLPHLNPPVRNVPW